MTAAAVAANTRSPKPLSEALSAAFGPGQVRVQEVLHRSDRAVVARGTDGGRPVIVKQFIGPDPADTIGRMQAEHAEIAPHMAAGAFRLAPVLRLDAAQGLAVLALAPGQRLDAVLARAAAPERAALLGQGGGWLAAFAAPRRFRAPMNLHRPIRRRKDAMASANLAPADRALTGAALTRLRERARDLAGQDLAQAAIHADFTPCNLHIEAADPPRLWGFDLQSTRRRPVALDAATFLVFTGLRLPPTDPGPLAFGLPQADVAAFLAACPEAAGPVLDVFIGDRLLRALHEAATPARAAAARAALHGWLA